MRQRFNLENQPSLIKPFSFIHTADIHLGSMQYGLEERREDFAKAFAHVVDEAIELRVNFMIIAGDFFDNPRPSSATLTFAISQLKRLSQRQIPVLAVNGSHDTAYTPETSILTPLDEADLLRFLPLHGSEGWTTDDCYVYGLFNYSSRLRLTRELPLYLREHPGRPEKPFNICVLHQGIEWPEGSSPYSAEIRENELPGGFQYYASGHLHRHAILHLKESAALFVYPGATETKEVREADESKGFCYVQVSSSGEVAIEHREIPSRRFVRSTVNCDGLTPIEISEEARERIHELDIDGCVIALTLEGSLQKGFKRYQVDLNSIVSSRRKALFVQVLSHLTEQDLRDASRKVAHQPRDLHERIMPYLKSFVEDYQPITASSANKDVVPRQADSLWGILSEAREGRLSNHQVARLSDGLTELAKDAPSNT